MRTKLLFLTLMCSSQVFGADYLFGGSAVGQDLFIENSANKNELNNYLVTEKLPDYLPEEPDPDKKLSFLSVSFGQAKVNVSRESRAYAEAGVVSDIEIAMDEPVPHLNGTALALSFIQDFENGFFIKFTLDHYIATEVVVKNSRCVIAVTRKPIDCKISEQDKEIRFSIAQRLYGMKQGAFSFDFYAGISANQKTKTIKSDVSPYASDDHYTRNLKSGAVMMSIDISYENFLLSHYRYIDVVGLRENVDGKSSATLIGFVMKF